MTMPRNFAKNTRLGHTNHKESTRQRDPKLLKPIEASLFNLFPTTILMDIDIWLSILEHRDKFKAVVTKSIFLSKAILFTILHEL